MISIFIILIPLFLKSGTVQIVQSVEQTFNPRTIFKTETLHNNFSYSILTGHPNTSRVNGQGQRNKLKFQGLVQDTRERSNI